MTTRPLINQFIQHVSDYLAWENATRIVASVIRSGDSVQDVQDAMGRHCEARAHLLRAGKELIPQLEAGGHDSTAVLKLLNAVNGGGGPAVVSQQWPEVKAWLQRVAEGPKAATTKKDSQKDTSKKEKKIRKRGPKDPAVLRKFDCAMLKAEEGNISIEDAAKDFAEKHDKSAEALKKQRQRWEDWLDERRPRQRGHLADT